jgi:hypothetical protein
MGMRQEIRRRPAKRIVERSLVKIARHGEEALGPEEPSAAGDLRQPAGAQDLGQFAAHFFERARVVDGSVPLAAAGLIEPGQRRNAFEQGRLAGAVLADDDSDRFVEGDIQTVAQERQAIRISRGISELIDVEPDPPEVWRW